jgi:hypothetical protein
VITNGSTPQEVLHSKAPARPALRRARAETCRDGGKHAGALTDPTDHASICETRDMDESSAAVIAEAVAVLRQAGARFAYLHGSRATGHYRGGVRGCFACHETRLQRAGWMVKNLDRTGV